MKRLLRPWILFGLCLALGLGAMAWITRITLRAGAAEAEAHRVALMDERVRVAIRQLDATLATILDPETIRPWFHYEAFHPARRAFDRMGQGSRGEVLVPSPLLVMEDPIALLRFQIGQGGRFSSPLVPPPGERILARQVVSSPARLELASRRLAEVRARLGRQEILKALARSGAALVTREDLRRLETRTRMGRSLASPFQVDQSSVRGFWIGSDLYLARQVWVGDQDLVQCCWVDWPVLREVLLSVVWGQLPEGQVVPVPPGTRPDKGSQLALLPIALLPGPLPPGPAVLQGPALASLAFAWGCALVGGLAGAWVLHRAVRFSEHRGAFASALTHELRTPLTTFRLYTELLAHGMVPSEEERMELLRTLMAEADRLDHVVKNVLAYARLESDRGMNLRPTPLGEVLDRCLDRLKERARQGGMTLEVEVPGDLAGRWIQTDALGVEQILLNLVDNACKYAGGGKPVIRLEAFGLAQKVGIRCRDHGPGIPPAERRALFRPFRKPTREAARRAPGVGLGLALSHRLARGLGGALRLEDGPGASFVLELPARDPGDPGAPLLKRPS